MISALRSWVRGHPRIVDSTVAVGLFVYNLPLLGFDWSVPPIGPLLISISLCGSWLLRRSRPLAVFVFMTTLTFVQWLSGIEPLPANFIIVAGLFNVALKCSRSRGILAAAALELMAVLLARQMSTDFAGIAVNVVYSTIIVASVWLWGFTLRLRRAYVAELQERAARLERERHAQARITAAAERARIAREIHDIVSHSLSAVIVLADGASRSVRREPERAEQALAALTSRGRGAMADMQRMLDVLRADDPLPDAPHPGVAEIAQLVSTEYASGMPIELHIHGVNSALDSGLELTVYRIVQEGLTNVRKHAGQHLEHVAVELTFDAEFLLVEVTDDGQRIAGAEHQEPPGGHGLVGMRERVQAHGGTLRAQGRPEGGFEIVARFPLGDNALRSREKGSAA